MRILFAVVLASLLIFGCTAPGGGTGYTGTPPSGNGQAAAPGNGNYGNAGNNGAAGNPGNTANTGAAGAPMVKFTNSPDYQYAHLISSDSLDDAAKAALSGFSVQKQALPDGSTLISLIALEPQYSNQTYVLAPGQSLYFIEKNSGDDTGSTDLYLGDDTAVVVDSNGYIVASPQQMQPNPAAGASNPPAPPPQPGAGPTVLSAPNAQFYQILTDGSGLTLYVFSRDAINQSNCNGNCSVIWPPLTTPSGAVGGSLPGKLGAIARNDGTMQVTYNGMPLYYYSRDAGPGDTSGEGFLGVWSVAQPDMAAFPAQMPAGNASGTNGQNAPAPEPVVALFVHPTFGQILTDSTGMALYVDSNDSIAPFSCTGSCAESWMPLVLAAGFTENITTLPGTVGTMNRPGGSLQVTYNGMPLYRYSGNSMPGEVLGDGIGGIWHVASAGLTSFPPLPQPNSPSGYGGGY